MGDCPDQAGHILHDNLCPHIKKILGRAIDSDLPELEGVVFMNSCDAMRRLYDAWQIARPNDRTILVDLPVTGDASAVRFFGRELMLLVKTLEEWSGEPVTTEAIMKGIRSTNEVAAAISGIREKIVDELAALDREAVGQVGLSSMCTVFAESEVVSLIAEGTYMKEIAHGLNKAIASRTLALVKRLAPHTAGLNVAMSGGVAYNGGVVRALSSALGTHIVVPPEPDTVGAYGAALIVKERF